MPHLLDAGSVVLVLCAAVLLLSGMVKGMVGIGMSLVAVPLLATLLGVRQTLVLLAMPIILANLQQALCSRYFLLLCKRLWSMLAALLVGILIGAHTLMTVDPVSLYLPLGTIVILFFVVTLIRPVLYVSPHVEPWLNPLVGLVVGWIGGMSSLYGPPLIIYLTGLDLRKELLVTAMAMLFFIGSITFALALAYQGLLDVSESLVSLAASVPIFLGIYIGQKLRAVIDEALFRHLIALIMLVTGIRLVTKALF